MPDHEKHLAQAAQAYRRKRTEMGAAQDALAVRVRAAAAAGVRQVDILRAIDNVWTREYLRKLARHERGEAS